MQQIGSVGRCTAVVVTAFIALAGVSACGQGSSDGPKPGATRTAENGEVLNDADVQFATNMVIHHAQGIQMVTFTDTRDVDASLAQFATQVRDEQVTEVESMTDWFTGWGEEVPATSIDHVNGGDDPSEIAPIDVEMPGLMSAEKMSTLLHSSDAEFRDLWLTMMLEHHQGAVTMAKAEVSKGSNPGAVSLAKSIAATSEAEIAQLEKLLGR